MSKLETREEEEPETRPTRYRELSKKKLKMRQVVPVMDVELQMKQLQRSRSFVKNLWEVKALTVNPHCQFDWLERHLGG